MKLINRFVLLTLSVLCLAACNKDEWEGVETGENVPEFNLTNDSSNISAASMKGKIYLLTFFNTECKDCQQELPVIEKLYGNYKYDISFLNVARSESEEDVAAYWNAQGFHMPYYTQDGSTIYQMFASSGIPRTYLVDANGVIRASFDDKDMANYETLSNAIDACIESDGNYARVSLNTVVSTPSKVSEGYIYNEFSVSKLTAYFYDADTKKLVKQIEIDGLIEVTDESGVASYVIGKDLMLRNGKYDMYCIANSDNAPQDITDEEDFLNEQDTVTYKDGIVSNISTNCAIMTSSPCENQGFVINSNSNQKLTLTVNLERVFAKVQITNSNSTYPLLNADTGEKFADVNITNYQIVNLNRTYYYFRHTAQLSSLQKPERYVVPDNFATDIDDGKTYVIDPYFFSKTSDESAYQTMAGRYVSAYNDFGATHMAAMPVLNKYAIAYILENTSYKDCQKNGYSVGVVFKASIQPEFVYLFNSITGELSPETSIEQWPAAIYYWNYNFYGSIQALNANSDLMLDPNKTYTEAELAKHKVVRINFNQGVYETYYTYWIRHNDSDTKNDVMKYGIVRNTFYRLNITGISGVGYGKIVPDLSQDNDITVDAVKL